MTTIRDIRTVGVTVRDQDAARAFFAEALGFEVRLDAPISPTMRWLEVAAPGAHTSVALTADPAEPRPAGVVDTGIRFTVPDAEAEHTALAARGVAVGELLRWADVPPMFTFDDPDGNRFTVVEDPS
jgi:catechol 2,3-dioxygenase-like lactoylglutathione lyase family enzyme